MVLLSKSKYLNGLQCLKYFWISLHEKDKIPETDEATQHLFDQGHEVGQLAKKLWPDGVDIPEGDFKDNLRITKESLSLGKPLFEPAFWIGDLYSRADILVPVGEEWDIIEVKSSTKVKDVNVHDVSFQKHVYTLAGLKIRNCYLMYINNKYVKDGPVDPSKLLVKEDITSLVEEVSVGIAQRIENMIGVMKTDLCPKVNISKHCSDPYDCPLQDLCWGFLPSSSVFDLYRGGVKCFKLLDEGVTALKDIPHGYKLSDKQGIQHQCEIENEVHVDVENLRKFLNRLDGTVNYLDFETFMTAVPLLDGVRPYQMVPFQWSLHVDGSHYEFLGDSREEFLASLKKVIGPGPVVVYNQSFEIGRLRELALEFPAYKEWVEDVISRVVDLYEVFKNFYYYNPKQKGSASLKAVVPAVLGRDPYADLGINKGGMALISYLKMMKGGKDCRAELLAYCKMDTEAMVWVVEEMRNLIEVG